MRYRVVCHNHRDTPGVQPVSRQQPMVRQRLVLSWPGVVAIIVLETLLSSGRSTADDTFPIWELTQGQRFTVRATTHRITEIQVGEYQETTDIADLITVQYTLSGYDGRGFAHFDARITSLNRTTTDAGGDETTDSLIVEKALKAPTVTILVGNHGNDLKVLGIESVFRSDFPQAHRVLKEICGHDIFQSWFDLPFRVPVKNVPPTARQERAHGDTPEPPSTNAETALNPHSTWTRKHRVSLGLPGTVQCDCACSIDSIEDFKAQFSLTGTPQLLPREPNEDEQLRFKDFELTASDVSGTGTILMDQLTGLPQSIQLTQKLSLEGQSAVASGERSYEFRFKQSLTQTSIASEFAMQDLRRGVPRSSELVR